MPTFKPITVSYNETKIDMCSMIWLTDKLAGMTLAGLSCFQI